MTKNKQIILTARSAGGSVKTGIFRNISSATSAALGLYKGMTPGIYDKGMMFDGHGLTVHLTEVVADQITEVVA